MLRISVALFVGRLIPQQDAQCATNRMHANLVLAKQ
jgi:hypothetical protein